jgi:hypothetical protein
MRWEAIIEVRERREALQKEISELSALPGRKARDVVGPQGASRSSATFWTASFGIYKKPPIRGFSQPLQEISANSNQTFMGGRL